MGPTHQLDSRLDRTIQYYQVNASKYVEQTQGIDMGQFYEAFLPLVAEGGRILDVGCGAGRDLKRFRDQGFNAEGIEPAPALANICRTYTGARLRQLRVEDLHVSGQYDGIWACASLLHIPRTRLQDALKRLIKALKSGGVLYMSFKRGHTDHVADDGRLFDDQTCENLLKVANALPRTEVLRCWETPDQQGDRQTLVWTNMLVCKLPD